MDNRQAKHEIDRVLSQVGSVQFKVHLLSLSLFKAIKKDGIDYNNFNYLYSHMGSGINKKAFKTWVVDFSPLKWNEEKQRFVKPKKANWKNLDITRIANTSFYNYHKEKKERKEVQYNIDKKYEGLCSRVDTLISEFSTHEENTETLRAIRKLLNALS